jgi:hypothetical protein
MYHNHLIFKLDSSFTVDVGFEKWITPEGLKTKAEDKYVIDKKNVNYILPDVSIPRFKMKVFADENKLRNTNKIENANCIIFSEFSPFKNYNSMDTSQVSYTPIVRHKTKDIIAHIKNLQEAGHGSYIPDKVLMKLELLSKTNPYIYAREESNRRFFTELLYRKLGTWYGQQPGSQYPIIVCSGLEELFETNPSIKFIEEKQLQKHISDNGIVINQQKYQELCKLIDTEESDNTVLAMEIMANSNFSSSLIFLYMLLIQRGHIMYNRGNVDHVNFKYLLNYFQFEKSSLGNNNLLPDQVETIFGLLKSHGQFTKSNVNLFLSFYNESNQNYVHEGNLTNSRLTLNKEIELDEIDDHDEIKLDDL